MAPSDAAGPLVATPRSRAEGSLHAIAARPRAMAATGAFAIAFSAILVREAHVSPSTAAVFRCAYAVPVLALLARAEDRRLGPRTPRARRLAAIAGVFFAADLIAWHHAIEEVGAGLSTVLANLQVVLVPLTAWLLLGERPSRRTLGVMPLMLVGVLLISGVIEHGGYGADPALGVGLGALTALTYAGFLLLLRAGGADLRRPAGALSDATIVGAIASVAIGVAWGDLDLVPHWPAHAWLFTLAMTSQVLGWLLISASLPRLPAATTSVLLTIQPVGSVLLGIVIFSEAPTALQLCGVAAIVSGLVVATRGPSPRLADSP